MTRMALRTLAWLCLVTAASGKKQASAKKAASVKEELRLTSLSFTNGGEFPSDNRGDEDNVSPNLAWTGAPKNTQSFVLIMDSEKPGKGKPKTHWMLYDIPKEVFELRDELSGDGASDVARLGMKEDAGQAPVVVDPMGQIDGWVDPEIEAMQKMIHGALDASFEERNRLPAVSRARPVWPASAAQAAGWQRLAEA